MRRLLPARVILAAGTTACLGYTIHKIYGSQPLSLTVAQCRNQVVHAAAVKPQQYPEPDGNSTTTSNSPKLQDMRLINVQIFFRHGARTPLRLEPLLENLIESNYDKDFLLRNVPHTNLPYDVVNVNETAAAPISKIETIYRTRQFKGGSHAGTLTSLGKQQMYDLGRKYRDEYIDELQFLSTNFKAEDIYLRSTNMERTISSLQCALAGMYPVHRFDETSPVKINVANHQSEILYPNQRFCESLRRMGKLIWAKEDEFLGMKEMKAQLRKEYDYPQDGDHGKIDLPMLRDNLHSREAHGLEIPAFIRQLSKEMDQLITKWFATTLCGPVRERSWMLKLAIGPVFQMIQQNIDDITSGKSNYKMHIFSVHDSSLFPMLVALGRDDLSWPAYSADIRIELYEDDSKQMWVRTRYCGEDLIPKGCDNALMPVEKFSNVTAYVKIQPDKWWCECQNSRLGGSKPHINRIPEASQAKDETFTTGV